MRLFQKILSKLKGVSIYLLACFLVLALAGPEIIVAMELSALMEAVGASTFLLMHWYAVRVYFEPALKKFKAFEGGNFFIPRLDDVASYPYLLMHALPDRSLSLLLLLALYAICGAGVLSVLT